MEEVERKRNYLPRMNLQDLPKSGNQPKDVFDFEDTEKETEKEVEGELYPEEKSDVTVNEDVAVFTTVKTGRPWVGRVLEVCENEVLVHWFSKKKRKYTYEELHNQDGTPQTDRIPRQSIMYRSVSSVSKETSFQITPTWLKKILIEYDRLDMQSG